MSPRAITRDERLRMRLAMQALSFKLKGAAVTSLERASLRDAVQLTQGLTLAPMYQSLREAAELCLAHDPLTEESMAALQRALDCIHVPKIITRPAVSRALSPDSNNRVRHYWQEGNMA